MPPTVTSTPIEIRVAPATSPPDWIAARMLVGELVEWLSVTVGVDVRRHQHDSDNELDDLEQFYREPNGRLLHAGIEAARSLGAESLRLETISGHMDTAIGMYRRAGFERIGPYTSLGQMVPNVVSLGCLLAARDEPQDGSSTGERLHQPKGY